MNKSHPHRDAALALERNGQLEPALEAFSRAKLLPDAARVARKLGRNMQAAQLYEAAGMSYEAAVCFAEAGDHEACLSHLVKLPQNHKFYRACCVKAIAIATQLRASTPELERFLSAFAGSAPQNEAEQQAMGRLGKLQAARPNDTRMMRLGPRKPASSGLADLPSLPPPPNLAPPMPTVMSVPQPAPAAAQPPPPPAIPAAAPASAVTSVSSSAQVAPLLAVSSLGPGAIIADRYRIDAQIGEGGMATVFRAHDSELEEDVAIKVFAADGNDPEIVTRFKQELALARKLAHPNILRMYDLGLDRGCRFISMELLKGKNLREVIRTGKLTLRASLGVLEQACAGLQAAHERGVVHRDIKPENLFVTEDGTVKVMDFGIAKNLTATSKTRTGVMAGTAAYMAPEQIEGFSQVTPLADIYALGIIAYELASGSLPFTHPELMPLLMMHLRQEPRPPIEVNPAMPRALNDLVLQLLDKDPKMRVQSCRELAQRFEKIRAGA